MSYSDLLKDPRWQKERLEILELDKWACRHCSNKELTLHVHHLYYEKGLKPWEYPDSALVTYCELCHDGAPKVNWQKAFFDLNFTEYELLDLAAILMFRKSKLQHTCRHSCGVQISGDLFTSSEDINEYYLGEYCKNKRNYIG
jgi:hypothetical protein